MSKIRIACETYTWQMPGEMYKGRLGHIMKTANTAGFSGIEPETSFFGDLTDPLKMKDALQQNGLELTALCHVEDWRNTIETDEERMHSDQWLEFLKHFPEAMYLLVQMPGTDRKDLRERQQNLLSCVNSIAERASNVGTKCSYHPNSPEGSIYRTEVDYETLLNGLNGDWIGYTPDVGHMAKVNMDPLTIIKQYRELINLVHYKDMYADGRWAATGDGVIEFEQITQYLIDTGYEGWIVMEDECDKAIIDPDGVTLDDGNWISRQLIPLVDQNQL